MSKIYQKITDLIGGTPLLELTNYEKKNNLEATVLGKLEYFNPAGSVKDRIAKAMVDEAEQEGKLRKVLLSSSQHQVIQVSVLHRLLPQEVIKL